jgi:hypothetical protein
MLLIALILTSLPGKLMDALTLLLIVDMCNREHEVADRDDRPAIYQPYTSMYPHLVSPEAMQQDSECYAYKKPTWLKI